MGIVPENEHLLGLEGSGFIRRLGRSVTALKIGQRVLVYEKGTFANRIQLTPERVYPLPDSMSFEVRTIQVFIRIKVLMIHVGRRDDAKRLPLLNIQSVPRRKYSKEPGKATFLSVGFAPGTNFHSAS